VTRYLRALLRLFFILLTNLLHLFPQCHKALKSGGLSSPGEASQMAQWVAAARAALQRGAASIQANKAVWATLEKAATKAEAIKKQEAEATMVGEASATKTDEAMMAKVDEAKAVKAFKEATLVDAGKMAVEAASMSPQTGDQLGGHGEEREIHTISSDEPPRPHGKGVLDTDVSSTAKMVILRASEGPEVEENLALVLVETNPWADPVLVFLGDSEETEEAH
jgi:hypothetical protein